MKNQVSRNKHLTGSPKKLANREREVVANYFGKNVHAELCRRILRNNDFHDRTPTKCTLIR